MNGSITCGFDARLFANDDEFAKSVTRVCMNEQLLPWDDLRLVLAVARAGSLSGAARTLAVSHATVFRRLGELERRLGVRLFERARRGYVATPAGEELATLGARIADEIAAAELRLAGRDRRPRGTVRITTTDTLLTSVLTPVLASFRGRHPEIELEVAVSNEMVNLSKRAADVAIRPARDPDETLVGQRISEIGMAVYAPAGHPATQGEVPDLAAFDWIAPDASLSYLPLVGWMARHGLEGRAGYRADSLVGMRDAVRAGGGLAVLPCYLADGDAALARVGPPIAEIASELWLLTHADLRRVARIRAFIDFVAPALRAARGRLSGTSS